MSQADPTPRPLALSPKIVSEVRELHQRCAELTRNPQAKRGRRRRRERRNASDAENDLLRVLGFESYAAFEGAVRESAVPRSPEPRLRPPLELAHSAPELSLVSSDAAASSLDARQTEAALLRVLRGRDQGSMAADVEGLIARVGACEEELAGARFELLALRDIVRARPGPWSIAGAPGEAAPLQPGASGYAAVVAELGSLLTALRRERAELTALRVDLQSHAATVLERARVDAEQERAHAHSEAARILNRARSDARALTRDAFVVVEGLRRIACEFAIPADDLGDAED